MCLLEEEGIERFFGLFGLEALRSMLRNGETSWDLTSSKGV